MGNSCGCCKSETTSPNTTITSTHANPNPNPNPMSSSSTTTGVSPPEPSPPSIESVVDSMKNTIANGNPNHQIDALILFIDHMLPKLKAPQEGASTSSSGSHLESVAWCTKFASDIIDTISKEAETLEKLEVVKELGSVALRAVKMVGESHWIFLGLSMVAHALERCLTVGSNVSECKRLLEEIVGLAKDVKKLGETIPDETEKLCHAVHVIVESAILCCRYIAQTKPSRYVLASAMETQLNKASQSIRDITSSLALSAVAHIARQFTQRINQSPLNLLDFNPEGIVDKIAQVKEMVDLEGSEEAVAVILWGFGGIGKSTLAASVVKELNPPAADFKFCRAIIDEKTPDMTSHIIKLQKDIIYDFGGGKLDLRNPDEGRQRLKQVVEKERCFLFLDNVVDPEYIKQLLPKDLFPGKKSKENMGSTEAVKEPKLRILITSRENNLRRVLFIKKCKEYHVSELSDKSAKIVFRKTILSEGPDDESELQYNFDEEGLLMKKVAEACKGVPLLLSVFSNCLRIERDRATYQQALKALRMGNLDSFADEKHLSEKLMFVYHKLSEPEAKKGFLDICTYFHGWGWTLVGRIVGSSILETLHKRKLVNISDSNRVIVHDILRVMGMKMGKETRITNYREFLAAVEDESRLKNVEGVMLEDNTCLATIESTHLDTMHRSLRVLWLGGWVVINGQCDRVFENIKYLGVGDVTVFPFRDMSKLENLTVFDNGSKSGMCLTKLPPTLKCIIHRVPYPDCDEFATLPLQNLQSSELFTVETRKSVKLPKGLKFPPSLVQLNLSRCMQLPSSFSHLTNLEGLRLNECDLESLPQGFGRLAKLKHLSMKRCSNLVHLSEGIGSLCCLTELSVEGCTRLEELPADFGQLTALRKLWMGECASLKALPENFGGLSSLEYLDLRGCISLQRLPESFSRLCIQSLTLESLLSLEELPESIGNLPCLTELILDSCKSLITLPHSFVQLKMLKTLTIKNCINLAALPKDFGELSSLENMTIRSSPVLNELPDGFSAPPALKVLTLLSLRNLVNLPAGFGKLKTLRLLILDSCFKLETLPDDLEKLVFLRGLLLRFCPMLEGAAWDKIARLQHCSLVHIEGSAMLIKRWKEVENEKEYPMVVPTGPRMPTIKDEEGQKAARAGLFSVELKCIELNTSNQELMERSSVSVAVDTTVAVILLPLHLELHHQQVLNTMSEVATQRSTKACSGQLQIIICLRSIEWDEAQQPTEEEEEKNIRKALLWLPQGARAIPVSDIRRRFLFKYLFFESHADSGKLGCFIAHARVQEEGPVLLVDGETIGEDNISGKLLQNPAKSESVGKEIETRVDELEECLRDLCSDSNTDDDEEEEEEVSSSSLQVVAECPHQPKERKFNRFAQALKKKGIDYFIDSNMRKMDMDQLRGRDVCIIICGLHSIEHMRLQQIFKEFQSFNFEGVWIPLLLTNDEGHGSYTRACEHMPWLTVQNPKLIQYMPWDNNAKLILFDKEGEMVHIRDMLSLVLAWGVKAYPFTQYKINEVISNRNDKSDLQFLLEDMDLLDCDGVQVDKELINNKLIFLYAGSPNQNLKMKSKLGQLIQVHKEFKILYIGHCSGIEKKDMEAYKKEYEDATQKMQWLKLSFWDTVKFWYKCKYLSNVLGETPNLSLTFLKLVRELYVGKRWLVFLDNNGMVTASGTEVVDIICKLNDENRDDIEIMIGKELMKSFESGKCTKSVQTYFSDEISNHRQHSHHLLLHSKEKGNRICNVCSLYFNIEASDHQRLYICNECDWDLCKDCWEEFVKRQAQCMLEL